MQKNLMNKIFDVENKIAIVTGGAGVLGAGICRMLASAGATVAILDINI